VDFVSTAPDEDEVDDGEEEPVSPAWLKGSLSPEPADDVAAAPPLLVDVELPAPVDDVAKVVAAVDPPVAVFIVDAGGPELAEGGAFVVAEGAAEEGAVLLPPDAASDLVPNPIL
jgi:hypothetical protein